MLLINKLQESTLLLEMCWTHIYCNKPKIKCLSSRGIDNMTLADFASNEKHYLTNLFQQICQNDFKLSPLKGVVLEKPNKNKDRLLSVPTVSDRIIHKAILSIIIGYLYPHINTRVSHCGIRKDVFEKYKNEETFSIKSAISVFKNNVAQKQFYLFKADIKGFFDNIPKNKLFNKISCVLPDQSLNGLIEQIIFFELGNKEKFVNQPRITLPYVDRGISQGSALSPIFSNLYLSEFDRQMYELCGSSFIRYADDFVIMSTNKNDIDKYQNIAREFLLKEGLTLSEDEDKQANINLKVQSVEFLGFKFNRHKISVSDKKEQKIIGKI